MSSHLFALIFTLVVGGVILYFVGRRQLRLDALKGAELSEASGFSPRHGFTVPDYVRQNIVTNVSEAECIALARFILVYWGMVPSSWRPTRFFRAQQMQVEIAKVFGPMTGADGATRFAAGQQIRILAAHPEFLAYSIRYADVIVKAYRHFNHFRPFRLGASWLPEDATIIALQGFANECAAASKLRDEVHAAYGTSHEEAALLLRYTLVMCFGSTRAMAPVMSELWTKQVQHLASQLACIIVQLFEVKASRFTADALEPHIDQLAYQPEIVGLLMEAADTISHHYDQVCDIADWHNLDPGTGLIGRLVAHKSLAYMGG